MPAQKLLTRYDAYALGLLLLAFLFVLALVPPIRSFPTNDDWAYAQSVTDLLNWAYKPHDWTQPTSLGHLAWGAIFSLLFGYSFTTLTAVTLVMSALCLVIFYLLLRHLDVRPQYALLGTALLGFNPIYVYLSYSFMTDVTFLTYLLAACLCYVRGLQGYGARWLLLGALAASSAYMTRQIGFFVVVAALSYLWWSRKWTWRRAAAISALPVITTISYMVWEQTQRTRLIEATLTAVKTSIMNDPFSYAIEHALGLTWMLLIPGLCLLPLLVRPRRITLALILFGVITLWMLWAVLQTGGLFPVNGNIIDNTGLLTCCNIAPIWNNSIWILLGIAGAFAISASLALWSGSVWRWLKDGSLHARPEDPAIMLYTLALLLAVLSLVISPYLFDRYLLPLLPFLMLPALRRMSLPHTESAFRPHAWRWAALLPIALFAIIGQRDYMERASTRWAMAESLVAQGVPHRQIYAGFEWDGWYIYPDGVRYLRDTGQDDSTLFPPEAVREPIYAVMELYDTTANVEIASAPYHSWLEGGKTRRMLVLKSTDTSKAK